MKVLIAILSVLTLVTCTADAEAKPFCVWVIDGPNETLIGCYPTITECQQVAEQEKGNCYL